MLPLGFSCGDSAFALVAVSAPTVPAPMAVRAERRVHSCGGFMVRSLGKYANRNTAARKPSTMAVVRQWYSSRCHGLAPWCLTLASTRTAISLFDATALRRGAPRWLLPGRLFLFSMPRPCAVVPHAGFYQDGYFSFR